MAKRRDPSTPRNRGGRPKGLPKTGGRAAGTPNKVTSPAAHVLLELGGLRGEFYGAQLHALVLDADPRVRIKALALALPYVWKKPVLDLGDLGDGTGSPGVARIIFELHPPGDA